MITTSLTSNATHYYKIFCVRELLGSTLLATFKYIIPYVLAILNIVANFSWYNLL